MHRKKSNQQARAVEVETPKRSPLVEPLTVSAGTLQGEDKKIFDDINNIINYINDIPYKKIDRMLDQPVGKDSEDETEPRRNLRQHIKEIATSKKLKSENLAAVSALARRKSAALQVHKRQEFVDLLTLTKEKVSGALRIFTVFNTHWYKKVKDAKDDTAANMEAYVQHTQHFSELLEEMQTIQQYAHLPANELAIVSVLTEKIISISSQLNVTSPELSSAIQKLVETLKSNRDSIARTMAAHQEVYKLTKGRNNDIVHYFKTRLDAAFNLAITQETPDSYIDRSFTDSFQDPLDSSKEINVMSHFDEYIRNSTMEQPQGWSISTPFQQASTMVSDTILQTSNAIANAPVVLFNATTTAIWRATGFITTLGYSTSPSSTNIENAEDDSKAHINTEDVVSSPKAVEKTADDSKTSTTSDDAATSTPSKNSKTVTNSGNTLQSLLAWSNALVTPLITPFTYFYKPNTESIVPHSLNDREIEDYSEERPTFTDGYLDEMFDDAYMVNLDKELTEMIRENQAIIDANEKSAKVSTDENETQSSSNISGEDTSVDSTKVTDISNSSASQSVTLALIRKITFGYYGSTKALATGSSDSNQSANTLISYLGGLSKWVPSFRWMPGKWFFNMSWGGNTNTTSITKPISSTQTNEIVSSTTNTSADQTTTSPLNGEGKPIVPVLLQNPAEDQLPQHPNQSQATQGQATQVQATEVPKESKGGDKPRADVVIPQGGKSEVVIDDEVQALSSSRIQQPQKVEERIQQPPKQKVEKKHFPIMDIGLRVLPVPKPKVEAPSPKTIDANFINDWVIELRDSIINLQTEKKALEKSSFSFFNYFEIRRKQTKIDALTVIKDEMEVQQNGSEFAHKPIQTKALKALDCSTTTSGFWFTTRTKEILLAIVNGSKPTDLSWKVEKKPQTKKNDFIGINEDHTQLRS